MRPLVLVALAAGCSGQIAPSAAGSGIAGAGGATEPAGASSGTAPLPPATCTTAALGPTPLRRLTRAQYDNTIRDLLRLPGAPKASEHLRADFKAGPFDDNAPAPGEVDVEGYLRLAGEVAAFAVKNLPAFVPCPAAEVGTDACAGRVAATLGARALRRPLAVDELAALERLYILGRARGGFAAGVELMLQWLLQSPDFLYHPGAGTGRATAGTALVPLTPHETAARLSYFLWDTMPDEALYAAAADGRLATPAGLRAEANRLLADPRSKAALGGFHVQLFHADRLADAPKDAALFPRWTPALREAMQSETRELADFVLRRGDGTLATLLTAPFSVVPEPLRAHYGVTGVREAGGVTIADLPPAHGRAGLLTHASVLSVEAHRDQTSPVKRGHFLRTNLLCQEPPPPPPSVNNAPPALSRDATTRERFAAHSSDPACSGCHRLIDPLGLAFETFDAVGAHRTTENGKRIDTAGELVATDVDGGFGGAADLARRLAGSRAVSTCVVRQWFRFALGRPDEPADACEVSRLVDAFERSGRDVRALVLALVESNAFRFRGVE